MKLMFVGAAHEVTGSCTYIEVGDKKGVVDYGMEQGKNLFENAELPVAPGELDFALVTHAHIDHSGMLPKLYKNGFRGSVYASAATVQLCSIMLQDSANIQMQEAEWKSRKAMRKGEPAVEPAYDLEDVAGLMKNMIPCSYNTMIQINDCVTVRFTDVGHLLGSSAIEVWLSEGDVTKKICFSGDVGNTQQPILKEPQLVKDADFVVIESTYGDRLHSHERVDYVQSLASRIQETFDKGGNVVIPSFAVGRTQEMLYFIREIKEKDMVKGHGNFPVYMDSPLAIEATNIFLQCDTQFLDEDMQALIRSGINPIFFPGLELAVSSDESKAINEDERPKVIISASGMCDAGRIRHHLKHNLWRPECRILFVGYQAVGTLGRVIVDGAKEVKLFNEEIEVKASIDTLPGISGHADKMGLINWLHGFEVKPKVVFVNHGDPDAADAFTKCLNEELGYNAFAPYSGTVYDLIKEDFEYVAQPVIIEKKFVPSTKAQRIFAQLVAAAERLLKTAKRMEGRSNKMLQDYTKRIESIIYEMEN